MVIAGNGLAGLAAVLAWRLRSLRGRWLWWGTAAAEVALLVQVTTGVALVASKRFVVPRFHLFYGFVGFLTVGIAYSSRDSMRGRLEWFYGLVGLFLMGVGLRAMVEVR